MVLAGQAAALPRAVAAVGRMNWHISCGCHRPEGYWGREIRDRPPPAGAVRVCSQCPRGDSSERQQLLSEPLKTSAFLRKMAGESGGWFLFQIFAAMFGPKAQPFSQPWASPRGTDAIRRYRPNGPTVLTRKWRTFGPLGRIRCAASVPRALAWAGRTTAPSGQNISNPWEQKADATISLPIPRF